ncbi:6-phosphogluconate dehydrogenase [Salinisphaera sp. T31B1]
MTDHIGLIGLGNIGASLCRHLLASDYDITIFDVSAQARAQFADSRAHFSDTVAELGERVDVAILSLPNSDVVEQVIFGDDGLADAMAADTVIIDMSSSRPASTREIAHRLAERRIHMLDAPVSGGTIRAAQGTLTMICGGAPDVFDRCTPVLRTFGSEIIHVGPSGAGHLAKAINNLVAATTLASACEAVQMGAAAGLAPEKLIEVINASSGRSVSTELKFPRYILNRRFDDGFAISLMDKDARIALDTAAELGLDTPIGTTVASLWKDAVDAGFGPKSHTAIYEYLETRGD